MDRIDLARMAQANRLIMTGLGVHSPSPSAVLPRLVVTIWKPNCTLDSSHSIKLVFSGPWYPTENDDEDKTWTTFHFE